MGQLFVAARALVYGMAFVFLWGWLALRARHLDLVSGRSLPFWTGFIGIGLFLVGAVVVVSCVAFFVVSGRGTQAPFDPPRCFVASGPYRFVRNPMYLGAFLVLAGFGLYARSSSVLGLTILAALFAHLFVFFVEEPGLDARFGESYRAYKLTVRRWIPGIPSRG